jgi:hypothetical protein
LQQAEEAVEALAAAVEAVSLVLRVSPWFLDKHIQS